ncbi:MAG: fasciclin domain-containing protein, partial [Actinomycetota bacterium]
MKNKALIRILAMLFAGVLVLAACGDDSDSDSDSSSSESTESTEAPAEEEEAAEEMDIVDTAIGAGDFSTLVAAVQAADLEETLR